MRIIDVSHYQGFVNFDEVSKDPQKVEGVFLKATQGVGYTDPNLKFNAFEAVKAGLKIGYYHYATLPTENIVNDAKAEAIYFTDTIAKCPVPEYPLVLDIEENKAHLDDDNILLWINTFFDTLKQRNHENYSIYSYTPFLNASLPTNHGLGHIPLWIAAYTSKPKPILPKGWDKCSLWQYSAQGKVNGIKGFVDINKIPD